MFVTVAITKQLYINTSTTLAKINVCNYFNAAASTSEAACVLQLTPLEATPAVEAAKVLPKAASLIPEAASVPAPEGTASAADELEQSSLQHFRQMNPKEDWIEEVLFDLRKVRNLRYKKILITID